MPLAPRKFLQYKEILELFPAPVRKSIYEKAIYKSFKRHEIIFRRGDEGFFLAGVMSGRLRMFVSSLEGKEMLITMIERGEIFGEMSVIDGMPRAVDVVAEADSTLLMIARDDVLPLLQAYPDAMLGLMKLICYRMRLYVHTMELIALQSLPVRLVRYMLRLAREYGAEQVDGKLCIAAGLSQMEMGQQLAISRESINKQLNVFAEKGYVALEDDKIILLDVEGLKRMITPLNA